MATAVGFRSLGDTRRARLMAAALRHNAEEGRAILMDRRNTSFRGVVEEEEAAEEARKADEVVVDAIRSVPCHY